MPRPFRPIVVALLALAAAGCQVWHVPGPAPAEYLRTHSPGKVRIHRSNGQTIVLLEPELQGDSLRGYAETTGRPSISLADIDSIAVKRTSWGRTVVLVAGVSAAVVAAALLSDCSDPRGVC